MSQPRHVCCGFSGNLACRGEWDMVNADVMAGLPQAGKHLFTQWAQALGVRRFGQQHHGLTQARVFLASDAERGLQVGAQQTLYLFGLYLDAAGTDDIVLATEDAKGEVRGER